MKIVKLSVTALMLCVGGLLLQSFQSGNPSTDVQKSTEREVVVMQGNKEIVVAAHNQTIQLNKQAFTMHFKGARYSSLLDEHHAFQVAAFTEKHQLDRIQTGIELQKFPFFFPGSDMAPESDGVYEGLVFSKYGHHKLYYEDATHKTTNLVSESGDMVEFSFNVDSFIYHGAKKSIASSGINTFYLAVLYDANLNGVIDDGELYKITVSLQ